MTATKSLFAVVLSLAGLMGWLSVSTPNAAQAREHATCCAVPCPACADGCGGCPQCAADCGDCCSGKAVHSCCAQGAACCEAGAACCDEDCCAAGAPRCNPSQACCFGATACCGGK